MFYVNILFKSIKQRKRRIFLAVLAVVMGASLSAGLLNIYFNVNDKVGKELRAFGPNIIMEPKSDVLQLEVGGIPLNSLGQKKYLDEEQLFKIKKIFWKYNIVGFAPFLSTPAKIGLSNERIVLTGTWFDKEIKVPGEEFKSFKTGVKNISPWWTVKGKWIKNTDALSSAMVGSAVAKKLNLKENDVFPVTFNDKNLQLRVAGIIEAGGSEDRQVFVNLPVVQKLTGLEHKVSSVKVSAMIVPENSLSRKDPKKMSASEFEKWYCTPYITAIVQQLNEVFPNATAEPIGQIAIAEGNMLSKINLMVLLVTVIALLASAVGVTTVMTANVLERRKEIGIIKAIGAESFQIGLLFTGEAAAIGLIGGLAGFVIGMGLAKFIGHSVFSADIQPDLNVLPITLIIALAVSLIGSILPVRRAVSTEPVIVLRGE